MKDYGYTLVQHSGVLTGHAEFAAAVEEVSLDSAAERRLVEKAGGVVLDTYGQAADLAEKLNYPPEVQGLIPRFRGRFSTSTVRGLRVAIPVREIVA